MKFDKITIKNYKCFDENGVDLNNLKPINIIIGRNNSGKSSLIETISFLTSGKEQFLKNKRDNKFIEIIGEHIFDKEKINNSFPKNTSGGQIGMNHDEYGKLFHNHIVKYRLAEKYKKAFIGVNKEYKEEAVKYFNSYLNQNKTPLEGKLFSHLSAERDIRPEKSNEVLNIEINGTGATNFIQQIINRNIYNSNLVEDILLKEINKIVKPDIEFSRILIQQDENHFWEIYFENTIDGRVPLSKMGSGIKTILLVLLILHIKPIIEEKPVSNYVFALEELENNLHPSLQRRLYYYLSEFTKEKNCILFITTHSNVVIDLYSSLTDSQIYHINRANGITNISSILKQSEFKKILEDLDIRASDILQSNGIIWVEGPSDRIYLKKWISLIDDALIEGYHYSIMFYGGRLLSNLTFDYELINNELIPLLKLNTNSFVLMDRDGKSISRKLNDTKTRIQYELGSDNVWITRGREIENYLTNSSIEKWLSVQHGIVCNFNNEFNTKIEESIVGVQKAKKIKYNLNKNKYSAEIVNYITYSDLKMLDLSDNINKLIKIIKQWNKK